MRGDTDGFGYHDTACGFQKPGRARLMMLKQLHRQMFDRLFYGAASQCQPPFYDFATGKAVFFERNCERRCSDANPRYPFIK